MATFIARLSLFSATTSASAPWPMYGGDAQHSREQLVGPIFATNATAWTNHDSGGWIYGAPAVGENETIYTSSWDGYLRATNPDGSSKWSFRIATGIVGGQLWSSPALSPDESTIYICGNKSLVAVGQDGAGGPVLRWTVPTGLPVLSSPTVASDGTIFFGGLDGKMRAVAADGAVLWTHSGGAAAIYASVALSGDRVFFSTMLGHVVALSRGDGSVLWSAKASLLPIPSSPAVSPDGAVVYSAGTDGKLRALRAADGKEIWKYSVGAVDGSSPAVCRETGTIFIGSLSSHLYAIAATGALQWQLPVDAGVQSSPCIGQGGAVHFTTFKSTMYVVEPNGSVRWTARLGGKSFSSPALGREGLYVGTNEDHGLYAWRGDAPLPTREGSAAAVV